jgi:hypothetical protein
MIATAETYRRAVVEEPRLLDIEQEIARRVAIRGARSGA